MWERASHAFGVEVVRHARVEAAVSTWTWLHVRMNFLVHPHDPRGDHAKALAHIGMVRGHGLGILHALVSYMTTIVETI